MLGFVDEVLAAGRMMDKAIKEDCEPDAREMFISSFINIFINVSFVYLCILNLNSPI